MRRKGGAPTHGSLRSPPACGVGDESRESGMQSSFSAWLALDIFHEFPEFFSAFFFFLVLCPREFDLQGGVVFRNRQHAARVGYFATLGTTGEACTRKIYARSSETSPLEPKGARAT